MNVERHHGYPARQRLRQLVMAARLYHVHGVRQREIAVRLGTSQAGVSRMLRQAEALGLVEVEVSVPEGLHPELEEQLERQHGLVEVHVVELRDDHDPADLPRILGGAAAACLAEATLAGAVVGFTSWSRTLQEMALAFPAGPRSAVGHVVEMLGDLGSPALQHAAARSTKVLAAALGAEPVFLRTPGVVATPRLRDAALRDAHVQRALHLLDEVDVAFVGVGPAAVHGQLQAGDSFLTPDQLAMLRTEGAAGQINQRFLDGAGRRLVTTLDDLVVGATLEQVAAARRRVVVTGGEDRRVPLAAALAGGWVDVLITDLGTARYLAGRGGVEKRGLPQPAIGSRISCTQ